MPQNWFLETHTAIFTHLSGGYSATPVAYPNDDFDPKEQAPAGFVRPSVQFGEAIQDTLTGQENSCGQLVEGFLFLQVFAPIKEGLATAAGWVDQLQQLFNKANLAMTSGTRLRFDPPTQNVIGEDSQGVWYQVNLIFRFHFHSV